MSEPTRTSGGFWSGLWAMLRMRCPRCRRGRMFRGWLQMNDPCPECGLLFQREEGYFLGAMYVSYGLGCAIVGPAFFIVEAFWPNLPALPVCLGLFAAYVPLMP